MNKPNKETQPELYAAWLAGVKHGVALAKASEHEDYDSEENYRGREVWWDAVEAHVKELS